MRIALTTAMLLAATMVCAEEPSSADTKPTPAAEATQASPAEPADPAAAEQATTTEQNTASETTADAAEQPSADDAAKADEAKPFKVPPGYRAKRINGKQMYCTASGKVTGARLSGKEQCRTEDQLRAIEKRKAEMEQR
jgi:hypothetical protein